ncbi:probable RNA-dependent RNA polymerase 3 [Lycium ferocissimum]|uniref:probable RNA-dependent RNA polymerase 3 n=1 Tax=Lycium ferocissimum TaxID=112874 RepID=UPI002815AF86|nr:probable RNA-dependent RNA polymerase 3 [Lycium ferocissimum]
MCKCELFITKVFSIDCLPSPADILGDAFDSPTSAPRIPSPPISPVTTSFQRYHYDPRPSEFIERANTQGISEQLLALSKLEFRKFFLILNYIGRRKLEDVIMLHDVGDILHLIYQPKSHFESYIWNKYGHLCEHNKRVQYLDWDSGKTHLYHCHVHSDGSYTFKGPYLKAERTHLQQSLGDENVLIVKFEENAPGSPEEIVQNGILVGLRRYRFFGNYLFYMPTKYFKYLVHLDQAGTPSMRRVKTSTAALFLIYAAWKTFVL